ncbi:MAG: tripartite tricarboxylate transporter substrate binding protein [Proteobacteria bacterium]|nr:tripartite tricarboxylate transporter substrate binding protein [Burkholderiales bacterium]
MKRHRCSRIRTLVAAGVMLPSAVAAQGAPWPEKPVRIVLGFAAGSSVDAIARLLGNRLGETWTRPVLIENVPGSAGNLAAERVARATPDGYTLYYSGNAAIVVNPSLYEKLGFDPARDFVPITNLVETPNVLAVHPSLPVKSVQALVALAKARPGELSYASAGSGTSQHLAAELFNTMAGVKTVHVPYKLAHQQSLDLLGGRVEFSFGNIVGLAPFIRQGRLRALAVSSLQRSSVFPDLPTMDELGFAQFDATAWFGLLAPTGTPAAIVRRIHEDARRALAGTELRARLTEFGAQVIANTPEQFAAQIRAETPKWAKLVKALGLKAD